MDEAIFETPALLLETTIESLDLLTEYAELIGALNSASTEDRATAHLHALLEGLKDWKQAIRAQITVYEEATG